MESVINPNIQLYPWLDKLIEAIGSEKSGQSRGESAAGRISMMQSLARIPDFVRYPVLHLSEIEWRYPRLKADCQTVCTRLAKMTELVSAGKVDSSTLTTYAHSQAAYGLLLSMGAILNGILRAFDPFGTSLAEDSASLVHEILLLAERASPFRPLAASYIPLCLTTGWAVTDDNSRKVEIEKYIADWQTDLGDALWLEGAIWLKAQYASWRQIPSVDFPENPLEICEVDTNQIDCDLEAAKQADSSCDVQ